MSRAVRVLHVDEEEPLLDRTARALEREHDRFDVVSETSPRDALDRIEDEAFDCVVSGYQLPELDGLAFLERVRESHPDLPFVLFTGQGSEEIASDAITLGATDYLRKQPETDQYQSLADRIERAVASNRARRELSRYEALVETVGDPMFVLEEDGVVSTANGAMAGMLGTGDVASVEGTHASEFLADGDYERGTEIIVELLGDPDRDSATYEVTVQTAAGADVLAEINVAPLCTETGEYQATVGVVRDISERKRRERRLLERKEELERYEAIVKAFPDEVITLDTDGKFTALEAPTGQERTNSGYYPEELLGEPVSTVLDEDDLATGEERITELLQSADRETASFEMDVVTKNGDRLPHENHLALLQDSEDGSIRGTVGVLRDISHRKQREKELERQNERLEEFAHIASHDLRNPLNVASGRLELAREDCDSEHLDAIDSALARMETLIEDTLAMAPGRARHRSRADRARDGCHPVLGGGRVQRVSTRRHRRRDDRGRPRSVPPGPREPLSKRRRTRFDDPPFAGASRGRSRA
ncbi:hypothetical protein GCM10028857_11290 [Salinarchaeum chitinilyticum]